MKHLKTYENILDPKPSDFNKVEPFKCIMAYDKSEHETIASNIMAILTRTGNNFRHLSWQEYKKERLKDKDFSEIEQEYFNNVIRWCEYANNAKQFSPNWAKVKSELEKNINKYNL